MKYDKIFSFLIHYQVPYGIHVNFSQFNDIIYIKSISIVFLFSIVLIKSISISHYFNFKNKNNLLSYSSKQQEKIN
jgi:low affinity Fe/Cu permease